MAADGTVCHESPACERVLGYTGEDVTGESLVSFVYSHDTPALRTILTEALEQLGKNGFARYRLRHHNGELCVLGITATGFCTEAAVVSVILRCHEAIERRSDTQSAAQSKRVTGLDSVEMPPSCICRTEASL